MADYITESFNRKQATGAIFLDVAKAFDRVWHGGLIYKMMEMGFPLYLIQLISSYLKDRKIQVKLHGTLSTENQITAGVPQGSILGPLLFNLFVSDIPKPGHPAILAQYADDTAILYRTRSVNKIITRLQKSIEEIEEWCRNWRIEINADKSTAILFSRRRLKPTSNVQMFETDIPWEKSVKYLGVTLDKSLTWEAHIKTAINKGSANSRRLSH